MKKKALAEFELEYNPEHKSQALFVSFEMVEYSNEIKKFLSTKKLNLKRLFRFF